MKLLWASAQRRAQVRQTDRTCPRTGSHWAPQQPLLLSVHGYLKTRHHKSIYWIKTSLRGISSTHLQINLWFLLEMSFQVRVYGSATSISTKEDAGYGTAQQPIYWAQDIFSSQGAFPIPHYLLCPPAKSSMRYTMDLKGEQNWTKVQTEVWAGRGGGRRSEYAHFLIDDNFEKKRTWAAVTFLNRGLGGHNWWTYLSSKFNVSKSNFTILNHILENQVIPKI